MYSVYQHWDKLKTCIVGKSYPPEFYSYITNPRVRNVMERIAIETEEDYQKLIKLLERFNVTVLRPELKENISFYKTTRGFIPPPMTPRDYSAMIGNNLFFYKHKNIFDYKMILENVESNNNPIEKSVLISAATTTRIGRDLYFGSSPDFLDIYSPTLQEFCKKTFSKDYRCHFIDTKGHSDGVFCPVVPGLIVSLYDIQKYEKTFPNWEVVYLPDQSWDMVDPFLEIKKKNQGKWWVPGEELNDDFTEFVESWLTDWVGYVEETVFDVNMLVIDKKNVVCNNYNKSVFDAFERYGITPHIINFRHRYFWDGGLHCITSDLDREGIMEDYFPERGSESMISL
jgi:hypothetical protein